MTILGLLYRLPVYVVLGPLLRMPRAVRDPDGREWRVVDRRAGANGVVALEVEGRWEELSSGGHLRTA